MNATTMTIQCTRCGTFFVLPERLLGKVRGKVGRIPCRGCREKIRLDARQENLLLFGARRIYEAELELDEAPSTRDPHLSLIPAPVESQGPEPRIPGPPPLPQRASLHPVPAPPRPSLDRTSVPPVMLPSSPFDDMGSLTPVVPFQGVRLTMDGRLVNRADEAPPVKRSRVRTWAPLVIAALLATGLASARLGRSKAPEQAPAARIGAPAVAPATVEPAVLAAQPIEPAQQPAPLPVIEAPTRAVLAVDRAEAGAPKSADEAAVVAEDTSAAEGEATDDTSSSELPTPELATPELAEFSKDAALVALQHATADAQSCRQPGDPTGLARVIITFAPSGRVTAATVTGRLYAGTKTGGCIASRFRGASIPAFSGSHVTVTKNVAID